MARNKKVLVDILLPVYNEEHILEKSVVSLQKFLADNVTNFDWIITIGDNASTDDTLRVAKELEKKFDDVVAEHLPLKGRGRMVKYAWKKSNADILTFLH